MTQYEMVFFEFLHMFMSCVGIFSGYLQLEDRIFLTDLADRLYGHIRVCNLWIQFKNL